VIEARRGGSGIGWGRALVAGAFVLGLLAGWAGESVASGSFPRTANIYFASLRGADLESLARWDVFIAPKCAQESTPDELARLKELNPDIIRLVHMPIGYNGDWTQPSIEAEITRAIQANDWYMHDTSGRVIVMPWGENGGDRLLDLTLLSQTDSEGRHLCEWLPEFIASRLGPGGLWEGVYLDFCMDDIYWLNNYIDRPIDSDRDGVPDTYSELKERWRRGTEIVVSRLRELVGDDYIIATNGSNTHYSYCNGSTRENFPGGGWYQSITDPNYGYVACDELYRDPSVNVMNACWGGALDANGVPVRTSEFERKLRLTFASTLVYGDGYFSFDLPSHTRTWWFSEYYDLDLGQALGHASSPSARPGDRPGVSHADMIKLRRFQRGVAVVNPTSVTQTISLDGTYYDLSSWNGDFYASSGMRNTVSIASLDGVVLVGAGRAVASVGGLEAEMTLGGPTLSWNAAACAEGYTVYRAAVRSDGSVGPRELLGVVDGPSYVDGTARTGHSRYWVAAVDLNDCEGQLSCPVDVSSELGSDLSLALIEEDEFDRRLVLTWRKDFFDSGGKPFLMHIDRTDDDGERVRLTDPAIDASATSSFVDETAEPGAAYLYRAVAASDPGWVLGTVEGRAPAAPSTSSRLLGCFPQPVASRTSVAFEVSSGDALREPVMLTIYDAAGRVVRRLAGPPLSAGRHEISWACDTDDGRRVASGCYLYSLGIGTRTFAGKMLVVR
jgi:hypothetical protein